ncbi:MAG: elongation factor G [Acidobacteriota bacterium]
MQVDSSEKIRNLAVAGHNDTGKTTLISALLYAGGAVNRMSKVEDGNTVTDFDSEEIERGISISLAPCFVPWQKHKINLIDCPGYGIFFPETRSAIAATDAVLLCINAVGGVEVTTEKVWAKAADHERPVLINLTKMDRERANFEEVVEDLRKSFGRSVAPIQIPIGKEHDFAGVVDLLTGKAHYFDRDGNGKGRVEDPPEELADAIEEWRNQLIEAIAETDEFLMEEFFEKGTLTEEELVKGLRSAVKNRSIFPLTMTSGAHGIGPSALLDTVVDLAPSPLSRTFEAKDVGGETIEISGGDETVSVLVFKTLSDPFSGRISILRVASGTLHSDSPYWNPRLESLEKVGHLLSLQGKQGTQVPHLVAGDIGGVAKLKNSVTGDTLCAKEKPLTLPWIRLPIPAMSFAIEPKAKGDEEKIGEALNRLKEEDISLQAGRDSETNEFLLSGSGGRHAEITVAKLKSRFNVEVILHPPKIPYRETIKVPADGHGRHKKQSGGRGQFADCKIRIEPMERGDDFDFIDEIFGGAIPQNYRPAVEKGIQEARHKGFLAGFPMVDFRVRLKDGQYHDVDSSEMAFKVAGSLAYKDAMSKAKATILEPMMSVEITTSEEFTGDVIGDLSQRRGRPQGMDVKNEKQVIQAVAPMSEMLDYARALRAITQGRSSFTMDFSHYEELPHQEQEKLIAERRREEEAEG